MLRECQEKREMFLLLTPCLRVLFLGNLYLNVLLNTHAHTHPTYVSKHSAHMFSSICVCMYLCACVFLCEVGY